jgi:hypothetical protein
VGILSDPAALLDKASVHETDQRGHHSIAESGNAATQQFFGTESINVQSLSDSTRICCCPALTGPVLPLRH